MALAWPFNTGFTVCTNSGSKVIAMMMTLAQRSALAKFALLHNCGICKLFCLCFCFQRAVQSAISKKKSEGASAEPAQAPTKPRKRGRWDLQQTPDEPSRKKSAWGEEAPTTPGHSNWDETPGRKEGETPGGGATPSARMWDATPGAVTPGRATPATPGGGKKNRWDVSTPKWGDTPKADGMGGETPGHVGWAETPRADRSGESVIETPGTAKRRSRWDETPQSQRVGGVATPSMSATTPSMGGATPSLSSATPNFAKQTPAGAMAMGMMTPSTGARGSMTPEQMQAWRWEKEMDDRNRPMSDDELDAIFPQDGYKVSAILMGQCVF